MSNSPWTEPPAKRSFYPSFAPRTRSIFTLRPTAHTEQPPPEPGPRPSRPRGRKTWAALAAAGALLLAWSIAPHRATPQAPAVYVNGAPKIKETPAGRTERWAPGSDVTVTIDDSIDQLGPGAREAVMSSFGTWLGSGASLPKLAFDSASGITPKLQQDGKNSVVYAPIEIEGHKNDIAITLGFADPNTGRLLEADIVINSNKKFGLLPPEADGAAHDSPSCNARYDLQSVVTHESGHFFGLDEDLDDGNATMYFKTGKCELKKRDLTGPDSTTMSSLYAGAFDSGTESEQASAGGCSIASGSSSAGFAALLSAMLCSIGIRSARRRNARRDSR